ncbi:MAG: ribonuclease HII [Leptospiraceae bacterium]|nr:ribonuclease HII [Leptospiraceae bacterium]
MENGFTDSKVFGVDEAGRGPLAGPLSFCILHIPTPLLTKIHSGEFLVGLDDSKKLTENKREELFLEINNSEIEYLHGFLTNRFIDKFGLANSIFLLVKKLHQRLKEKNFLLIDGNYRFEPYFSKYKYRFSYQSIIKGDSRVASIACASIIAKVKRDRYMKLISTKFPEYGFHKHKGYGTKEHRKKIDLFGLSSLHRKSFSIEKERSLFED